MIPWGEKLRYREAVGMTRSELELLVAIVTHEYIVGCYAQSSDLRGLLGTRHMYFETLTRGGFVERVDARDPRYVATRRAFRLVGIPFPASRPDPFGGLQKTRYNKFAGLERRG